MICSLRTAKFALFETHEPQIFLYCQNSRFCANFLDFEIAIIKTLANSLNNFKYICFIRTAKFTPIRKSNHKKLKILNAQKKIILTEQRLRPRQKNLSNSIR